MPPTLTPTQRGVIAAHKHDTVLHLLAAPNHLRPLADAVARRIAAPRTAKGQAYGRVVRRVPKDDPGRFASTATSWCLAVLLGPDPDWPNLLRMGRRLGVNGRFRIQFHLPDHLDPIQALDPWTTLTSTPEFADYSDENNLLKHVLEQLNNQSLRDHAGGSVLGIP